MNARLPSVVEETLRVFVDEVRRRFGDRVVDVRLFGSYARGEAHEESDVDVLVLLAQATRDEELSITELAADLIWQLQGVVISPLCMSPVEFEAWKAGERRAALEIAAEGVSL
jgi:predicted nucleotidyltransferase